METFFGSSDHTVDEKGRLVLPSRFLDEVPKKLWKFHLTAGLDRCLLLHTSSGFEELTDKIGRAVPGSRAHRALCRRFLGHSEAVVPDGNRRIRIPETLLRYAGLATRQPAVLIGTGKVIEIWSPDGLGETLDQATPDEETLFASLIDPTIGATSTGEV